MTPSIAFLCTANSCRSQIAEAMARHLGIAELEVFSAGTSPGGINPHTKKVLEEQNLDLSGHRSKSVEELPAGIDYVVTVCDNAARHCPDLPAKIERMHWPIKDPLQQGSEEEIMQDFRRVREEIRERVSTFLRGRKLLKETP